MLGRKKVKSRLLFCVLLILLPGMAWQEKDILIVVQQCKNKKLEKCLKKNAFSSAYLTDILKGALKLGLCVTCCACKGKHHETRKHSAIIAQLLDAGADGETISWEFQEEIQLLKKGIEGKNITFDPFGIIRLEISLEELKGAIAMQKE